MRMIRDAMSLFQRDYGFRPHELYLPVEIYMDLMADNSVMRELAMTSPSMPPKHLFGMKLSITDGPLALICRRDNGWVVRWTVGGFDECYVVGEDVVRFTEQHKL